MNTINMNIALPTPIREMNGDIDFAYFYVPHLLVELQPPSEVKQLYHNGLFHYKKELSLLKTVHAHRRQGYTSDFTSLFVRPWKTADINDFYIRLDQGALPFFETVEKWVLYLYDRYTLPLKSFERKKYNENALKVAMYLLKKKEWPSDFFLEQEDAVS